MSENNKTSNTAGSVQTSSSDGSDSTTTPDSEVQEGAGVTTHEKKSYDKGDDQQEYIEEANNNTKVANSDPVKNGEGQVG